MKISILGYMGSGKSTIGKQLAKILHVNFNDLDEFVELENNKSVSRIFSDDGEIKFRKMERAALIQLLESSTDAVISLGGGTPVYYNNMEFINENSFSVYLRLSIKDIIERLKNEKQKRPLIAHLNDEQLPEFIAKHLFERRNFYEQAHLVIDVKEKTIEEIALEITKSLPLPK